MNLTLSAVKLAVLPYGLAFGERRPGIVILVYHRVGGGTRREIDLPVETFARQVAYLAARCRVVSLEEALALGRNGATPPGDVLVLTFDDGYRETYDHVFPILHRYRLPATVYVATAYVEQGRPFDFGVQRWADAPGRPLTWSQLREMTSSGLITVGSHTHTHADLSVVPLPAVREELRRSQELIEERLGQPVRHFAYPWGRWRPEVRGVVGERFQSAVRGGCGKNPYGALDPLALWRQPVQRSDGLWFFRARLRSYLDGEEVFRSRLAALRAAPPTLDG
ncbi:MAG: polysaccharide deacetylase family protein [Armatimonadota bacterium]|nr:polysaccharide deacetylase family protein [Armatimonadota bacterium]MDR7448496.1 polysaccharide deacetylase family protein [Armatimonadota bacterium]MDR7459103.1 polysaccharide deacetylase family protein [Armatimonadota bacterium]MDR7479419.1 polysaccharide deacetylase family protein [Armatimonadota bacterium]MDR7487461.1 polysaccharide deacetylase family protein [Armatimonadota bacterium]